MDTEADNYVNDASVEMAWAIKAAKAASIHMNLLLTVEDTRLLRLNKRQDEIHAKFRQLFPAMSVERITEEDLKGADAKSKWRDFCEHFADVEDFNLGTMMRLGADGIYDEANSIVTTKVIYLAIEAARNVEGINEKWRARLADQHRRAAEAEAAGDDHLHVVL